MSKNTQILHHYLKHEMLICPSENLSHILHKPTLRQKGTFFTHTKKQSLQE